MRKPTFKLYLLAFSGVISCLGADALAADTPSPLNITANNPMCQELLEAADEAALAVRGMGKVASEQVKGGTVPLEEESCFGDIAALDWDFSALSGVGWQTPAIDELKKQAMKQLEDYACSMAQSVTAAVNTLTDCNASVGISASAGLDGSFELPSVESCGGLQADYQFDVDVGEGNDFGGSYGESFGSGDIPSGGSGNQSLKQGIKQGADKLKGFGNGWF